MWMYQSRQAFTMYVIFALGSLGMVGSGQQLNPCLAVASSNLHALVTVTKKFSINSITFLPQLLSLNKFFLQKPFSPEPFCANNQMHAHANALR